MRRAHETADFIGEARAAYGPCRPGGGGLLQRQRQHRRGRADAASGRALGAALLRAMVPLANPPAGTRSGTPVLMLSGAAGPIVPASNAAFSCPSNERAPAWSTTRAAGTAMASRPPT